MISASLFMIDHINVEQDLKMHRNQGAYKNVDSTVFYKSNQLSDVANTVGQEEQRFSIVAVSTNVINRLTEYKLNLSHK